MGANYTHTSRSDGTTLSASIYNADHQNHIDNMIPSVIDDQSSNDAAMQATTDPYPAAAISKPTNLQGELERLRYVLAQITGEAQWYIDPDVTLATLNNQLVTSVYKTADVTINSDDTLNDDADLTFSNIATGYYSLEAYIEMVSSAAADFKYDLDATNMTGNVGWTHNDNTGVVSGDGPQAIATDVTVAVTGSGVGMVLLQGYVNVSAAANSLTFRWSQGTSDITSTSVKEGSWIKLTKQS